MALGTARTKFRLVFSSRNVHCGTECDWNLETLVANETRMRIELQSDGREEG